MGSGFTPCFCCRGTGKHNTGKNCRLCTSRGHYYDTDWKEFCPGDHGATPTSSRVSHRSSNSERERISYRSAWEYHTSTVAPGIPFVPVHNQSYFCPTQPTAAFYTTIHSRTGSRAYT